MEKRGNVKSQVWIETAIYTLIGLTIIAIILSIATPQIQKYKERGIITQTIEALGQLDNEIQEVAITPGNVKVVQFKISQGKLEVIPDEDKIVYTLENSILEFSEVGKRIKENDIIFSTETSGRRFDVILELVYDTSPDSIGNLDITFNGGTAGKTLSGSGTSYKLLLENLGAASVDDPVNIDVRVG